MSDMNTAPRADFPHPALMQALPDTASHRDDGYTKVSERKVSAGKVPAGHP